MCLLLAFGGAASSATAPPANDNFANATTLSGTSATRTGDTNVEATLETGENPVIAGGQGANSVWYVWTAPLTGVARIDTFTSSFDTLLGVYTGSSVTALTTVAENDDWAGGTGHTSRVRFRVTTGTTYHIKVDVNSDFDSPGTINLHLFAATPPANDAFSSPTTLSTRTASSAGVSNEGAWVDAGESTDVAGSPGGASVWYAWTAPVSASVTIDTATSTFDTLLGVYTGTSVDALTEVASNDDTGGGKTSAVTFTATGGTLYHIRVDGVFGDTGTINLHLAQDKGTQVISVTTHAPANAGFNSKFTVAATALGGAVAYSSAGACSNVGAQFTMTSSTGTCSVMYDQAGGTDYNAAPQVVESVTAQKGDQTISVSTHAPATAVFGASFGVAASAPAGVVTFSSSGACSNSGNTFTMTSGTGTCSVKYDQAGSSNYNAAPQVVETVTAQKATQAISVSSHAPANAVFGTGFTVAATGGASGNAVTFSSAGACTNTGSSFTMTSGTGTCSVRYDQLGNGNYSDAPQVVETVTAQKAAQAISVSSHAPATAIFGAGFTVAATGGASGNAVTFSSSGVCTNTNAQFTMTSGTGTCSVKYDQAGNANYNAAPQVVETVAAQKAAQTISVTTHAPAAAGFGTSFGVDANAPGGAVSFSSVGACSNVGSTFTMTASTGTCTVRYDQSGNGNFNAAPQVLETVTAQKGDQTISVTTHAPATAVFATGFPVAATGGGSGNAVTFSSAGACTNTGATFTMTSGTGTCTVTFDQAGSTNYNAAPQVVETVTAQKASQTISVSTHAPATALVGTGFAVDATALGGAVTYSSSGACTNTGKLFTMTSGSGTCTVMYDQPGGPNFDAAPQVVETVTAQGAAPQAISVSTHAPATAVFGTGFTVAATGGASGNPVTFSSSGACTNTGATFTMTSGTGTCSVKYDQAGNADYDAAPQVVETVTAQKASQAISVSSHAPANAVFGAGFTVAASAPGGAVSFSAAGSCTSTGATFTMTSGTGTCSVKYDQAGNGDYSAAPQVVESVTAQKAGQTISVTTHAPASALSGSSFTVAASAPGGAVSFSAAGSCTSAGATFTMTSGTGTCSVKYDQAGNGNYNAAAQVVESVDATAPPIPSFTLTVSRAGTGSGTVTGTGGINCGTTCTASLASGTSVTLSASASSGSQFTGWSGACSGTGACTVTMSSDQKVTATFATVSSPPPPKKKVYCVVPNLKGKTLSVAKRKLASAHCKLGKVTKARSKTVAKFKIVSQSQKAGKKLRSGTKINVVLSRGRR